MLGFVQTLNDKISKLESIQQEGIEKGNWYIWGTAGFMVVACVVAMYFGGVDPGDLGNTLNFVADQSNTDITSQNVLFNENLKHCLRGIENMNRNLLTETTRTDHNTCAKLNVVLNSMITKDTTLNSIFSRITKSGWE